ncbi:MAG TPA: cupin domain-containing protein [Cyclobacteriaceae bacterium]|nr:cupin domain-containing protein [Cyclobacteriaceae bacterium]
MTPLEIVDKLQLKPHPEGGFFREIYRSEGIIPKDALGTSFPGDRNYCTAIYFLLTHENFSAFHRIRQDELWHFYSGDPLQVHVIDKNGLYVCHEVGSDISTSQAPQLTVPAGCWFASGVKPGGKFSLVGCTVAPGFDFADFELANRSELLQSYPQHSDVIERFTRVAK